jgi:hypothetical protein
MAARNTRTTCSSASTAPSSSLTHHDHSETVPREEPRPAPLTERAFRRPRKRRAPGRAATARRRSARGARGRRGPVPRGMLG